MNNLRQTVVSLGLVAIVVVIIAGVYLIIFLQGKISQNAGQGTDNLVSSAVIYGDECDFPENSQTKNVQIAIKTVDVDVMKKKIIETVLKYVDSIGSPAEDGQAKIRSLGFPVIILSLDRSDALLKEIETLVRPPDELENISVFKEDSKILKQNCNSFLEHIKTLQAQEKAYLDRIKVADGEEFILLLNQLSSLRQEIQNYPNVINDMKSRIDKAMINISLSEFLG